MSQKQNDEDQFIDEDYGYEESKATHQIAQNSRALI